MGFCFYNNVAVGAAHARERYGARRIAILDFDVHQCNGTIDIFKNDPDVLICTSFQFPFYPWRYLRSEWQNVVNTPLEAGTDSTTFRQAIEDDWLPALHGFKPDLVLVSAGFDAHREDPIADLCLEDEGSLAWRWILPHYMPTTVWSRCWKGAITSSHWHAVLKHTSRRYSICPTRIEVASVVRFRKGFFP